MVVEKDGTLSGIKILRPIGTGGGEEFIRILNTMPKWTPGKQRGKIVRVQYTLPMQLTINEKTIIAPYFGDGLPLLALQAIYKTVVFPEEVLNEKVKGTVEIRFNVETDGSISNPTIVKGLSADCYKAVLKALEKMPKWTPAQRNSDKSAVKAENCRLLIPINATVAKEAK